MKPQCAIEEMKLQAQSLLSDLYTTWYQNPQHNIVWNMMKSAAASKKMSLNDYFYWHDIKRVARIDICFVWSALDSS